MRIVLDLQGAQSDGSRHRGIGRYSLWLAQAMARRRGSHDLVVALNAAFPEAVDDVRDALDGLLPREAIVQWRPPATLRQADPANAWRRRCAEAIRETFLASLEPDMVVVSSLFEGYGDDTVTSIGSLGVNIPTAVILYDLIPFIHRRLYLQTSSVEQWYEGKLDHLRRADLLLSISESSSQEAIDHLGIEPARCVPISTATDPRFRVEVLSDEARSQLFGRFGIARPYVMYTGGIDHRKNIDGLIRAYALLPQALRRAHQLAVVCSVRQPDRDRLQQLARAHGLGTDELVLTGFVDDADLVHLYNACKLFVFPSWHEGFGLPALEAMACGRAVIAAGTSSLPEVVGCPDALFDPHDPAAIAHKITEVLSNPVLQAELERHGLQQSRRFTWDGVADRALRAIEASTGRRRKPEGDTLRRPRLAFLSPLPPERSGISDYSSALLRELARHYRIDVVVPQASVQDPWIQANCAIRSIAWFEAHHRDFDRVLYHVGNSTFHQHMFALLEKVPGVVALHDFFLGNIAAHMELTSQFARHFCRALYQSHGYGALYERFQAQDPMQLADRYPCNLQVLCQATGVITHSRAARELALSWYGDAVARRIQVVPFLKASVAAPRRIAARKELGISDSTFVVCSFGLLGPTKSNHRLLQAWYQSSLPSADDDSLLIFVGENEGGAYGASITASIAAKAELRPSVRITGWVGADDYQRYLAAADTAVQLRSHSRGETSAAAADCMSHGIATIVNAHGSLAELDDDCVWKLPAEFENGDLVAALEGLRHDRQRRCAIGDRARAVIHDQHAPRECARRYEAAIEAMYRRSASGVNAAIEEIARNVPASASPGEIAEIAGALDESIPPPCGARRLFVDVTALLNKRQALPERVRRLFRTWVLAAPRHSRVEPVHRSPGETGWRYARRFTLGLLECPPDALEDTPLDCRADDTLFLLYPEPHGVGDSPDWQPLRRLGATVAAFISSKALRGDGNDEDVAMLAFLASIDAAVCDSPETAEALRRSVASVAIAPVDPTASEGPADPDPELLTHWTTELLALTRGNSRNGEDSPSGCCREKQAGPV